MWEQVKTRADQHIEQILADQEKKVTFFFYYSTSWEGTACMQEDEDLLVEISLPGIVVLVCS